MSKLGMLALLSLAAGGDGQTQDATGAVSVSETREGSHDFDFWMGSWNVKNRRLRERLKGSTEWDEFEASAVARPLLNGLGNEDEYRTDHWQDFVGMSFRFFDPATRLWSIYWADSRRGALDPPLVGSFAGDTGVFLGADTFEGRRIRVRFIWSRVTTASPRWEQAFSDDDGKTWETNWVMEMTRDDRPTRDFPVVEFRRYTIKPGEREHFAETFETYFPESFQQLGAIAFGQFFERKSPSRFTWIRGFPSLDARATINGAFYSGPLWKEHAATMNGRLIDSDDVLLLRPLSPERGIPVLPAVDPVSEGHRAARGVVVAHLFHVEPGTWRPLLSRPRQRLPLIERPAREKRGCWLRSMSLTTSPGCRSAATGPTCSGSAFSMATGSRLRSARWHKSPRRASRPQAGCVELRS